jgi:arginine:pyruvate transaminase
MAGCEGGAHRHGPDGARPRIAHTAVVRYASITTRLHGGGSRAWEVHERGCELAAQGRDVILLSIGEPDFAAPPHVVDALVDSIRAGRNYYTPSAGERPLRHAIARHVERYAQRPIRADNVVFLPGAQAALFAVMVVLAERGDEILLPEPAYATYEGVMATTGASVVHVPLHAARDFHLDPADVAARITDRTRVLVLNTPHNPTGARIAPVVLDELGALAREHDLWIVSDEVYADLVYDGEHASALAIRGCEERVAVVGSLSKSHAMTGFRHGWMVGPEELVDHVDALLQSMLFGSPPFVQDAGLAALEGPQGEIAAMRDAYARRARLVVDALRQVPGIAPHAPEAGMFVMADVRGSGLPALEWALQLLEAQGVSVTPTDGFGPSGAGHVRIGLVADEERLAEACRRIAAFQGSLAPQTISA